MKKILLFLILVLSITARADYGSYHLTFTIETKDGKFHKGYEHIGMAYFKEDSLYIPGYFRHRLEWMRNDGKGNLIYYKTRNNYEYANYPEGKSIFYYLADSTALALSSIKNITLLENIESSYASWLENIDARDTKWIKSNPIGYFDTSGYLCSYRLIIHKRSNKLTKIINELKALENTIPIDERDDDFDDRLDRIISKLKGLKVVVVTSCTC